VPRAQYPSDEQRKKQRPHVKIHLSARSHPRYGEVFEDPETRGVIWGLWLLAVQYHAAQTGDEVALGYGDLAWLTGSEQRTRALRVLRASCARMGYTVREDGKRVLVTIRNLQRKQGFHSALNGVTTRTPPPSEEPKNRSTDSEEQNAEEPKARSARAAVKTPPPDELSTEDYGRVRDYFALVSPGHILPTIDARIEDFLLYAHEAGKSAADWALAAIRNIVSRENRERDRRGEPQLQSLAQARATAKRRALENAAATPPVQHEQPELVQ
jgi:hypothetical protein